MSGTGLRETSRSVALLGDGVGAENKIEVAQEPCGQADCVADIWRQLQLRRRRLATGGSCKMSGEGEAGRRGGSDLPLVLDCVFLPCCS
jgi:hypothetical protein